MLSCVKKAYYATVHFPKIKNKIGNVNAMLGLVPEIHVHVPVCGYNYWNNSLCFKYFNYK